METPVKPVPTSAASQKNEVTIFIVDDDPMYRKALEHQLRKNSAYKTHSYGTGEECIKSMDKLFPNIVILDYRLNDLNPNAINGIQVLQAIKKSHPQTEVIMLSSQKNISVAMGMLKPDSIQFDAYDYVTKGENSFSEIKNSINQISNNIELINYSRKKNKRIRISIFTAAVIALIIMLNQIL